MENLNYYMHDLTCRRVDGDGSIPSTASAPKRTACEAVNESAQVKLFAKIYTLLCAVIDYKQQ